MDINLEEDKLGELLVDSGVITREELEHTLQFQENMGGELDELLVQLDFVTEEQVVEAVADQQNVDVVNLRNLILPQDLIDEVPQEVIEEQEVIPIGLEGDNLRLAVHDPFDVESIEEVGLATDYHIEPVLAPRKAILQAIDNLFYGGEEFRSPSIQEESRSESNGSPSGSTGPEEVFDRVDSDTFVRSIVRLLIDKGVFSEEEIKNALPE